MVSLHQVINRAIPGPDVYVWALQQAYSLGTRLYDPSFALAQDPAIDEKIRRDPIILQAMNDRRAAIAGRDWSVQPASDDPKDRAAATVIERLLSRIGNFRLSRMHLADAVFRGRSYAEVIGERQYIKMPADVPDIIEMWWVPRRFKDIDPRRVRWGFEQGVLTSTEDEPRLEIWSLEARDWVPVSRPQALISVVYDDTEATLGYGRGLREAIYHYYWAKGIALREGLQALERWAQGWFVAKVDSNSLGGTDTTPGDAQTAYLNVLKAHRARFGGVVIDKDDNIETHFPAGTGSDIVMSFIRMLDDGITRLVTGSLHPAGGGDSGGSLARAEVEQDTSDRVVQLDREVLDEAITQDLVSILWQVNRENFVRLGLAEAEMPHFVTTHQPAEDPQSAVSVVTAALGAGIPLRRDEVYRKLGFTMPDEGDEVIEGQPGMPGGEEGLPGGLPGLPFASGRPGGGRGVGHFEADFDEEKHSRDDDGKFAPKGSGGGGGKSKGGPESGKDEDAMRTDLAGLDREALDDVFQKILNEIDSEEWSSLSPADKVKRMHEIAFAESGD